MKKLPLLLIALLVSTLGKSQRSTANETMANLGGGSHAAFTVIIQDADVKTVTKKWNSWLKSNKGKVKEDDGELTLQNGIVKRISPDTINLFSRVEESGKDVILSVAGEIRGNYISHDMVAESEAIKKILVEFSTDTRKDLTGAAVAIAAKLLKEKTSDYEDLVKEQKKLEEDNADMKDKIKDNERRIKELADKQEDAKKAVDDQKSKLDETKRKLDSIE